MPAGDVVIARSVQNPRHVVCKRVLGLEGDVVNIPSSSRWGLGRTVKVPKGHVWLQGDNFNNSTDSRHYGPVPYAMVRGRVFVKPLSNTQQQQLEVFLDTLFDWNSRMNLTGIKDRAEYYERHVSDSLALLPVLDACLSQQQQQQQQGQQAARISQPVSLIDVGSGAGLPGMVLAIARPSWQVTLLDSLQKRCTFMEHAAAACGLANVSVRWARAEEAGQDPGLREQHQLAVARAVAELRLLAELCLPLVQPGSHWVAAKGPDPQAEVAAAANALGQLGGKLVSVQEVESVSEGAGGSRRTAVVVAKARRTPAQYPRKPGVPAKRPL
ncbi:hypothetical protein N2152v2_008386 [Parachlorella kessleri]